MSKLRTTQINFAVQAVLKDIKCDDEAHVAFKALQNQVRALPKSKQADHIQKFIIDLNLDPALEAELTFTSLDPYESVPTPSIDARLLRYKLHVKDRCIVR